MIKNFIESLGFVVNNEKSNFVPSQIITFLGFIVDSVQFKVFLPEEKLQKILKMSISIVKQKSVCIRDILTLEALRLLHIMHLILHITDDAWIRLHYIS